MNLVNKTLKNFENIKNYEIILSVLVLLYIVSGVSTPYSLSPLINNMYTYFSLVLVLIILLIKKNYLLVLMFAVFSVILLIRSKKVDYNLIKPSQDNKNNVMKKLNSHLQNETLEEQAINNITKKPDNIPNPETYHPVLCSAHGADEL